MVTATAAVALGKSEDFTIETVEIDEPRGHEILVKVASSGICHTDVIVRDQWYPTPLPAVLGHEGSGVVEAVGDQVTKVKPGDHVVMSLATCGTCDTCLRGLSPYCASMFQYNLSGVRPDGSHTTRLDGKPISAHFFAQSSFATYSLAYEDSVVKVSNDAPLELIGPLGCGVQTGAGGVLGTLHPAAGESIVILGCGAVGLSALMAAKVSGCSQIIGVDLKDNRLELAKELGATDVVKSADRAREDVLQEIQDLSGGGVNHSVETTGVPEVFRTAVEALVPKGSCAVIGAASLGTDYSFDMNDVMIGGKSIKGHIESGDLSPQIFIPRLVKMIEQGIFPLEKLTKTYALRDINQAVNDSIRGVTVKPILVP